MAEERALNLHELQGRLQRAAACVTASVLRVVDGRATDPSQPFIRFNPRNVRLPGSTDFHLSVNVLARSTGRHAVRSRAAVSVVAYYYSVSDERQREILAYHWHPHIRGVEYPHLHVSAAAVRQDIVLAAGLSELSNGLRPEVADAHLLTGLVDLEAVVALSIRHFGVPPRRQDWETILHRKTAT